MTADKIDTKTKILDIAEKFILQNGYSGFSFRDIAEQVGIKSASVHYHFPTKEDLAARLMSRYTTTFSAQLPDTSNEEIEPKTMLNGFINGFKEKIVDQQNMSLCTILTSDKAILPELVCTELALFYQLTLGWLTRVFMRLDELEEEEALVKASQLLASLHGASILVQGTNDSTFFEKALADWRIE